MPPQQPQGPKHKTLSAEEQQAMTDRLYTLSMKTQERRLREYNEDVKNIADRRYQKPATGALSEGEEKNVQRLYTQSMERKQYTLKKLETKFQEKPPEQKKLQQEEIDGMSERLYLSSKQHREQMIARLDQKFYGKKGDGEKKLSKADMDSSVARQYGEAREKKQENYQKLENKYLFQPPKKTIAAEDVAAMADRLSKKESQ